MAIGEGFDAAIRIGERVDTRLVARRLCDHVRILCASPDYLAQHGTPVKPADLSGHNCLGFSGLRSFPEWRLMSAGQQVSVKVAGSLRSNDNEALLEAARRGVGILAGGDWLMGEDLASDRLVRVLPQWQLDVAAGIYLVRPTARLNTAASGVFKTWLEDRFKAGAPWRC